jgi:hypothetical protein
MSLQVCDARQREVMLHCITKLGKATESVRMQPDGGAHKRELAVEAQVPLPDVTK